MLSWIAGNLGSILICLGLCAVVALVIAVMAGDRKKGKSSCGCSCGHCPMSGSCHNH